MAAARRARARREASRVGGNTLPVPCSARIPLGRFLGNDEPTPKAMCELCSSSALGRARSTPWIAQAQTHSAPNCGTNVSLRPQRHFFSEQSRGTSRPLHRYAERRQRP